MSITRNTPIDCPRCRARIEVFLADSVNGGRHPHLREAILQRRLHTYRCAACDTSFTLEKELTYFDFERRQYLGVVPARELYRAQQYAREFHRSYETWLADQAPEFIRQYARGYLVRICFGYEELREKLIIDDAGLSDLVVEALKCDIMLADPVFPATGVVTLRLDSVAEDRLIFRPEWLTPPANAAPAVIVQRSLYETIDARYDDIPSRYPTLASGPHVSLLRAIEWPDPDQPRPAVPAPAPAPAPE